MEEWFLSVAPNHPSDKHGFFCIDRARGAGEVVYPWALY